jgi:hypothetical protein
MPLMDVEVLASDYRKASRSVHNGACVEVGSTSAHVLVRDSINPAGAVINYPQAAWQGFINSAKVGAFDLSR